MEMGKVRTFCMQECFVHEYLCMFRPDHIDLLLLRLIAMGELEGAPPTTMCAACKLMWGTACIQGFL